MRWIDRALSVFTVLLPLALLPPRYGSPLLTAQEISSSREAALIQQAGLRWLVEKANQHPSGALKTSCFVYPDLERESPEVDPALPMGRKGLQEFMRQDLGIAAKPEPACDLRAARWRDSDYSLYFDVETGEPAALFGVGSPEILEPLKAQMNLLFLVGRDWGENLRCSIERKEEGWVASSCLRTGIF